MDALKKADFGDDPESEPEENIAALHQSIPIPFRLYDFLSLYNKISETVSKLMQINDNESKNQEQERQLRLLLNHLLRLTSNNQGKLYGKEKMTRKNLPKTNWKLLSSSKNRKDVGNSLLSAHRRLALIYPSQIQVLRNNEFTSASWYINTCGGFLFLLYRTVFSYHI